MTLDSIVIIALSLLVIASISYSMILYKTLKNSGVVVEQLLADKYQLLNELSKEMEKGMSKSANDPFVKFLTDSRDSAFEYIENAQNIIKEYMVVAEKLPVAKSATKQQLKEYKEVYDKLIELLPVNGDPV